MNNYFQSVPRWWEVSAGIIIGLFSLLLLTVGSLGIYKNLKVEEVSDLAQLVIIIFLVTGYLCGLLSYRLIFTGAKQRQTGLFSPNALRFAGTLFLLAPILFIFSKSAAILEIFTCFSASAACFALAKYRESYQYKHGEK